MDTPYTPKTTMLVQYFLLSLVWTNPISSSLAQILIRGNAGSRKEEPSTNGIGSCLAETSITVVAKSISWSTGLCGHVCKAENKAKISKWKRVERNSSFSMSWPKRHRTLSNSATRASLYSLRVATLLALCSAGSSTSLPATSVSSANFAPSSSKHSVLRLPARSALLNSKRVNTCFT